MQRAAFTVCFFLLVVYQADAQSANLVADTITTRQLQPVEVRGLRAGANAPFAKTDISRDDIAKSNLGQDLPVLLQYTPSAVVTSDAGAGVGYTGLRIRGTDGTRINVTLNGVPVNDAESQGTFFVDLPDIASSVNSIQLQRGVGTSTNGPGAFGATMSISTLRQVDQPGAEANVSASSFNTQKYTLLAGTGLLQGGWQFDVRLSKISSDGYVERSASDLRSLQFIAGWKASDKTCLHFMLLTGTEKTGQAWDGVPQDSLPTHRRYNELGLKSDGTYYNNQTDNYQQDYYQLFLDHKFNTFLTAHVGLFLTRGKGYYEEYKMGESYGTYGLADFITPTNDTFSSTDIIRQLWLDNYNYGTVFSLLYDKDATQFTFGGGWSQYIGQNYGYIKWSQYGGIPDNYKWYSFDGQKNDLNLYLKWQQALSQKWMLYADMQWRTIGYFITGFRSNPLLHPAVTYNFLNPKAGLTYLLQNSGSRKQKLYASIAVANHEPNHDDYEAALQSLPKPERLYDGEAGYEIARSTWSAGANLYYMYYRDQLVLTGKVNDVGAYTRVNVPNSYRAGIELMAAVKPTSWVAIAANATFSQNRITNFTEYVDNYDNGSQDIVAHSGTDIAFSPAVIAGGDAIFIPFGISKHGRRLEIDVLGKYVGRQYLDNTGNKNRSIKAYDLCDLRLRYVLNLRPFREVAVTLAINNVLNHLYESNGYTYSYISAGTLTTENYYYPQAGRNVLAGVSLQW